MGLKDANKNCQTIPSLHVEVGEGPKLVSYPTRCTKKPNIQKLEADYNFQAKYEKTAILV